MKKYLAMFFSFFPAVVIAAAPAGNSALSFSPPPSDFSVVFLGNIFGIVDGVLHGTGSQIMGNMFAVFNAAVLALGGIVIMYTLLVSTMNTAHEGQMLGQKWSSIWIPVRATMGLALRIPKATGYCLMQIFVMWVVVQGIGAADKVWAAALDYLNRGGVVVQTQMNPTTALTGGGASAVPVGAQIILAGEVCMIALQAQLQSQLQLYQSQKQQGSGPCAGSPSGPILALCNSTIPSFVNSVNFVDYQDNTVIPDNVDSITLSIPMPNFKKDPVFSPLTGICGTITWNTFSKATLNSVQSNITSITDNDKKTASLARVTAIQQMYLDLQTVAQAMVNNDPGLAKSNGQNNSGTANYSAMAAEQFGVPQSVSGTTCASNQTPNCILWGAAGGDSNSTPLFNGTEFQGAIQDYNGIMLPTLNLVAQSQNSTAANNGRAFIQTANSQGWIMAGSYFFDLVNLNVQASANGAGNLTDSSSGLDGSSFDSQALTQSFGQTGCQGTYATLCTWMNNTASLISPIRMLIDGTGSTINPIPLPAQGTTKKRNVISTIGSSTVYGYTNNATILQMPNQPGVNTLQFANLVNISIDPTPYYLPYISFGCGSTNLGLVTACLGALIGEFFYNIIIVTVYNAFLAAMETFLDNTINLFLMIPLAGMMSIFKVGLDIIDAPGVNPVVALAQMGTYYINFSASLYLMLIEASIAASMLGVLGIFIFALMMMTMPILLAWMGIMLQIGFSTAYYVPILPYLIFTFGAIAWVMAVVEAMVAAPIVALGVTHPEGHDAFGKGEAAIMILMNVFLRPAMMIIGFIAGISMTYVSVWIINAGFDNAIGFIQGGSKYGTGGTTITGAGYSAPGTGVISGGYTGWAGVFAYFFSILIYTTTYLTVVQKSFTLIASLPDKVLRWIGGQAEGAGQEAAQWAGDVQKQVEGAGKETGSGQAQMDKQVGGYLSKGLGNAGKGMSQSGGSKTGAKGGGGGKGGGGDGGDAGSSGAGS